MFTRIGWYVLHFIPIILILAQFSSRQDPWNTATQCLCIRSDLVWYFTYYITVSDWRTKMATDFCHAMLCINAAYVVMRCLSIYLPHHFSFPYQTGWWYFNGNPLRDVECRWCRQKLRFWAYIFSACCERCSKPGVVNRVAGGAAVLICKVRFTDSGKAERVVKQWTEVCVRSVFLGIRSAVCIASVYQPALIKLDNENIGGLRKSYARSVCDS